MYEALVNQENLHWSVVVKHASFLWHVDSRVAPMRLNRVSFRALIRDHSETILFMNGLNPFSPSQIIYAK